MREHAGPYVGFQPQALTMKKNVFILRCGGGKPAREDAAHRGCWQRIQGESLQIKKPVNSYGSRRGPP
jgi:hypothetical protein